MAYSPFTVRQCPKCGAWVDGNKVGADYDHVAEFHPEELEKAIVGIPYFHWNEEEVTA